LGELFVRYRERLRQMIRLRLDRRLYGRIDASDVLQEAYVDVARRFPEYNADPAVPFYLWLRSLTGQRLITLHRQHLGAQIRDAGQEVSLYRGALPQASSISLAHHLLGRLTSPTQVAVKAEMQLRLQEALNAMDPLDREVLVLRHFEELTNNETAEVLGLAKSAASKRYIRALERLREVLENTPGFPVRPGDEPVRPAGRSPEVEVCRTPTRVATRSKDWPSRLGPRSPHWRHRPDYRHSDRKSDQFGGRRLLVQQDGRPRRPDHGSNGAAATVTKRCKRWRAALARCLSLPTAARSLNATVSKP
jgi:RNA polymerase sigma-70 factor (ECF subfamily)